jgi:hypothetical protein
MLFLSRTSELKILPIEEKVLVKRKCLEMVVRDTMPFSVVAGSGFKDIFTHALQLGAKHGDLIDVQHLLPCPQTISNSIADITEDAMKIIKQILKDVPYILLFL